MLLECERTCAQLGLDVMKFKIAETHARIIMSTSKVERYFTPEEIATMTQEDIDYLEKGYKIKNTEEKLMYFIFGNK